jgi:hypothetical protein
VLAIIAVLMCAASARAQQDPEHESPTQAAHDHQHHHPADDLAGGPFRSASAVGSGTALQPSSMPMWGWHFKLAGWDASDRDA